MIFPRFLTSRFLLFWEKCLEFLGGYTLELVVSGLFLGIIGGISYI